jgi:hypothetical protein
MRMVDWKTKEWAPGRQVVNLEEADAEVKKLNELLHARCADIREYQEEIKEKNAEIEDNRKAMSGIAMAILDNKPETWKRIFEALNEKVK